MSHAHIHINTHIHTYTHKRTLILTFFVHIYTYSYPTTCIHAYIPRSVPFSPILTLLNITLTLIPYRPPFTHKVLGVNVLGSGPWSTISYAVPTAAGTPAKPIPPKASDQTMASLTYCWDAPDDNGYVCLLITFSSVPMYY